ncbi:MAG: hypothetical protein HYU67_04630 [Flavobacteriia bacterium]|nr:hypothetical protein [Flavobacteriia bacterium]
MALELEVSNQLQNQALPNSEVWFPITLNLPGTGSDTDTNPAEDKKYNTERMIKMGAVLILLFSFILFVVPKLSKK